MNCKLLATDYDETVAESTRVRPETLDALRELREAGIRLVLTTGPSVENVLQIFPGVNVFHLVLGENGSVMYDPDSKVTTLLGDPPPAIFVETLKRKGVDPLSIGLVMVAAWSEHLQTIKDTISELNLPLEITYNNGAAMVTPAGVNKGSGLRTAAKKLGIDVNHTVAVGDAENDWALLNASGYAVAVANAVPELKAKADLVTTGRAGNGVTELVSLIIEGKLQGKTLAG